MTILKIYQKSQYLTPNNFYEIQNTTKSKQLYIHLNISSISYHINDLVSLITNCKTKLAYLKAERGQVDPLFQISILIIIFMNIFLLDHQKELPYYIVINHYYVVINVNKRFDDNPLLSTLCYYYEYVSF